MQYRKRHSCTQIKAPQQQKSSITTTNSGVLSTSAASTTQHAPFIFTHSSQDVFLFNGTSVFHPFISWDFHLAKLITLSNQVDYHIPRLKINKLINKKLVALSCGGGSNSTQPLLQVRPTKEQLCLDLVPWVDPGLCAKSESGTGLLNNLTVNIIPGCASRE